MSQPAIFREDRIDVMQDLIRTHPFAVVVASASGALSADHVPLVLHAEEGRMGTLRGHFGAANPLFRATDEPIPVLSVFQGPHSYVTPSWYVSKSEHGRVVPTWNYAVVHARGALRFIRDADWLLRHLDDLTAQHEAHRQEPWALSDAPDEFVKRQLRGLVGFEIAIADLTGTWKMSQNRIRPDRQGVAAGLRRDHGSDKEAVATLVEERARR